MQTALHAHIVSKQDVIFHKEINKQKKKKKKKKKQKKKIK